MSEGKIIPSKNDLLENSLLNKHGTKLHNPMILVVRCSVVKLQIKQWWKLGHRYTVDGPPHNITQHVRSCTHSSVMHHHKGLEPMNDDPHDMKVVLHFHGRSFRRAFRPKWQIRFLLRHTINNHRDCLFGMSDGMQTISIVLLALVHLIHKMCIKITNSFDTLLPVTQFLQSGFKKNTLVALAESILSRTQYVWAAETPQTIKPTFTEWFVL